MKHRILALALFILLLGGIFSACSRAPVVYVPAPVLLGHVAASTSVGIAFHSGNAQLRDQVWAALQVLAANGTVAQAAYSWFGYNPSHIPPDPYATAHLGDVQGRTFIVGFDSGAAPKSFFNPSGELVGFDIDLARAVADYFGWQLELLPIKWANRAFELTSGNIDSLWGGVPLSEYTQTRFYYTPPYIEHHHVLITMSNSGVRNLRRLHNSTVALLSGSTTELALEKDTSFRDSLGTIAPREILYSALLALEHGHVDAVLMDEFAALYYMRTGDAQAFGGRAYRLG